MIEHRSSLGVGILDGFLFAVGGYNGQMTVNTVERFNPRTQEWSMITEMSTERSMLGVTSLNGELYAVGMFYRVTFLTLPRPGFFLSSGAGGGAITLGAK